MLSQGGTNPKCFLLVVLLAGSAFPAAPVQAQQVVVADTLSSVQTRDLARRDLAAMDAWYVRGFDSLFGITKSEDERASRGVPVRVADEFRPYRGLKIRSIRILSRESFGTVVVDSTTARTAEADDVELETSRLESVLNAMAWSTREGTLRKFLLFEEGEEIDPFDLADSERLLRQRKYVSDTKIVVDVLASEPGWADVVVFVRERWPIGVKAKVITLEKYNFEIYHRNLMGRGLNLEYEVPVRQNEDPAVGYRVKLSFDNLSGSFIDTSLQQRHDYEASEWDLGFSRDFVYPGIRALGGVTHRHRVDHEVDELPEDVDLEIATVDSWLGWNFPVRDPDDYGKKRVRLVPAVRHIHTDFVHPAREYLEVEDRETMWRDSNRYLSQATLLAVDYHATNLVYSYGETEDVPSGAWAAPVVGWEATELQERLYHAIGVAWATFTERQRFFFVAADYGGWRNEGRFEDGVLDVKLGGFSALTELGHGYWRHFFRLNYSLGINRVDLEGLRLDEIALRDLDNEDVAGDHRLALELESLLFTRYSILGFKIATFAYAAGGFVGLEDDPLLDERFSTNVGVGLRLNNPLLAIPTAEARIGLLSTESGVEAAFSLRMKDLNLFRRGLPSVVPEVFEYR